jgi:hypothetical protein
VGLISISIREYKRKSEGEEEMGEACSAKMSARPNEQLSLQKSANDRTDEEAE